MKSATYEFGINVLLKDEIVKQMASEIPEDFDIEEMEGWEFMMNALEEYRNRGGKNAAHMGSVAEAIKRIVTS